MTSELTFEELELASRLLPSFEDKRDLTTGHQNQEFAAIRRNTRHGKLARLGIAEVAKGRYGAILLRRGPRWAFDPGNSDRAVRDQQVVQRLEIGAWPRKWLPGPHKALRKRFNIRLSRPSNVIPFERR